MGAFCRKQGVWMAVALCLVISGFVGLRMIGYEIVLRPRGGGEGEGQDVFVSQEKTKTFYIATAPSGLIVLPQPTKPGRIAVQQTYQPGLIFSPGAREAIKSNYPNPAKPGLVFFPGTREASLFSKEEIKTNYPATIKPGLISLLRGNQGSFYSHEKAKTPYFATTTPRLIFFQRGNPGSFFSQEKTKTHYLATTKAGLTVMPQSGKSGPNVLPQSGKPGLIVLPVFSLETDPSQDMSHYQIPPSRDKLEARMDDFVESLQYSLDHPHVVRVNLMYTQDAMPGYIINRIGRHPKLTFDKVNSTFSVGQVLEHIHKNFQNKLILLTNGDVYPGHGLELVDYDLMKSKRLFYGLSRHGKQEKRCFMSRQACDLDATYRYAQDSYIFIPTESFPAKAMRLARDLMWDYAGAEYVLMYIYHTMLNYKMLNPCHVIFMYHNHCSELHHSYRPFYANDSVYFKMEQSSSLQ